MEYIAYLREQAEKFRRLADEAEDAAVASELRELAAVCDQAAEEIEDRLPSG